MFVPIMGSAGAAGAAAAIAQAVKASGAVVRMEPQGFQALLRHQREPPLVVHTYSGYFGKQHKYLSSYKGLAFYTQSPMPIELPSRCELVEARAFWMPQ